MFLDMEAFDIDLQTGFAALDNESLPTYYEPWTVLVSFLSKLLESKQIGNKIAVLPLLSTKLLIAESHWRRAYVTLGFLIQAYIWETKEKPRDVVPACLAEPFIIVCRHLGMMPVLSYAGLCLWNCVPRTDDRENLENDSQQHSTPCDADMEMDDFTKIQSFGSFTGTRDEDAFNLVPVMVEVEGAKLIPLLLQTLRKDDSSVQSVLESTLKTCTNTLRNMSKLLTTLHDNCKPNVFFHQLRPFLAGSAGNDSLPNGVSFLQTDKPAEQIKCVGGSAGQSALFQYLDHMLGISHSSTILLDMRAYMPRKHREFLTTIDGYPSLRDLCKRHPENKTLQELLQECISSLREWRTKHITIVARYIVQPGRGSLASPGTEERGTAGSLPVPFLKQYRDETAISLKVAE